MFALGNDTFASGICSARKQLFEEASGETEVGRRLLPPEPRPLPLLVLAPRTRLRHANRTPNLNQHPQALFCLKLDNSCCYARYSCGNNCNVVVKLVQECKFFMHVTPVTRKQFAGKDTFLREANSYKRALTLRNSWLFNMSHNQPCTQAHE